MTRLAISIAFAVLAFALTSPASTASPRSNAAWSDSAMSDRPRVDVGEVRPRSWRLTFRDPTTIDAPDPATPAPTPQLTREHAIALAATEFGASERDMLRVSKCENTSGDPGKYGDHGEALGIFQFHEATYLANARRAGLEVADRRADPLSSARVAAWMFSRGHADRWTCR